MGRRVRVTTDVVAGADAATFNLVMRAMTSMLAQNRLATMSVAASALGACLR